MSNSVAINDTSPPIVGANLSQEIVFTQTADFGNFVTPQPIDFDNFNNYSQVVSVTFTAVQAPASFNVSSTNNSIGIEYTGVNSWVVSSLYSNSITSGNSWELLRDVLNGVYYSFLEVDYTNNFTVQVVVTNGITTSTGSIRFNGWLDAASNITQNVTINENQFGWTFAADGSGQPAIADVDQAGRLYKVTFSTDNGGDEIYKLNAPNAGAGAAPAYSSTVVFTGTQATVNTNMATMDLDMGPDWDNNFVINYTQEVTSPTAFLQEAGTFTFTPTPNQPSTLNTDLKFLPSGTAIVDLAVINDTRGQQAGLSYTCTATLPDSLLTLGSPWVRVGGTNTYTLTGSYISVQAALSATALTDSGALLSSFSIDLTITRPQQKGSSSWTGTQTILTGSVAFSQFIAGLTWSEQVAPVGAFYSVAATPTHFVAVGDKCCMYSTDGINWTYTTTTFIAYAVCYGAGRLVAVGPKHISHSTDNGISWTTIPVTTTHFATVAYDPVGKFMAGGSALQAGASGDTNIMVSSDGVNWVASQPIDNTGVGSLAYFNSEWYATTAVYVNSATGYTNFKVYKRVGIWVESFNLPAYGRILPDSPARSLVQGGGYILFYAKYGVYYSTDGLNWTGPSGGMPSDGGDGSDAIYASRTYVTCNTKGGVSANANAPFGWASTGTAEMAGKYLQALAYKNGVTVAVAYNNVTPQGTPGLGSVYRNSI